MSEKEKNAKTANQTTGKELLKDQNPNQQHNVKKEALGPNTKR